ncbi:MAG: hypothetical protein K2X37_02850 [Chitinophagaceae bacterium]|nr:hypothetical protein [Chitinophagaceae bacterium]
MKKILLGGAITLLYLNTVSAQTGAPTTNPANPDVKAGMKDLRKDMRDVRKDEKARKAEFKEGDKEGAKELTKDIRADKKDIHENAKALKAQGVGRPIRRADHQIHRANRRRNG